MSRQTQASTPEGVVHTWIWGEVARATRRGATPLEIAAQNRPPSLLERGFGQPGPCSDNGHSDEWIRAGCRSFSLLLVHVVLVLEPLFGAVPHHGAPRRRVCRHGREAAAAPSVLRHVRTPTCDYSPTITCYRLVAHGTARLLSLPIATGNAADPDRPVWGLLPERRHP